MDISINAECIVLSTMHADTPRAPVHTMSFYDICPSISLLHPVPDDLEEGQVVTRSHKGYVQLKAGQVCEFLINSSMEKYDALSKFVFTAPLPDQCKCPIDCSLPLRAQECVHSYLEPVHELHISLQATETLSRAQKHPLNPSVYTFPLQVYGTGTRRVYPLRATSSDYIPTASTFYTIMRVHIRSRYNCCLRVACLSHQLTLFTRNAFVNDSFWYACGLVVINGLAGKIPTTQFETF